MAAITEIQTGIALFKREFLYAKRRATHKLYFDNTKTLQEIDIYLKSEQVHNKLFQRCAIKQFKSHQKLPFGKMKQYRQKADITVKQFFCIN